MSLFIQRVLFLLALAMLSLALFASIAAAIEIDDEAISSAVDKATDLLRAQNMTVQLTDEQRAEIKEKMGRMAKQAGPFLGGFGGRGGLGGSKIIELLLLQALRNGGGGLFGNNNNNNNANSQPNVVYVPAGAPPAPAPVAPPSTSAFDLMSLISLLGLALLLISLLPTGF